MNLKTYLGKTLKIAVDRPLGSKHPEHGFTYEVNYGYIPGTKAPDNEPIDAYLLGENKPVKTETGVCVAIVQRLDDNDDKLVVVAGNRSFSKQEIEDSINFQEKWFKHKIITR